MARWATRRALCGAWFRPIRFPRGPRRRARGAAAGRTTDGGVAFQSVLDNRPLALNKMVGEKVTDAVRQFQRTGNNRRLIFVPEGRQPGSGGLPAFIESVDSPHARATGVPRRTRQRCGTISPEAVFPHGMAQCKVKRVSAATRQVDRPGAYFGNWNPGEIWLSPLLI